MNTTLIIVEKKPMQEFCWKSAFLSVRPYFQVHPVCEVASAVPLLRIESGNTVILAGLTYVNTYISAGEIRIHDPDARIVVLDKFARPGGAFAVSRLQLHGYWTQDDRFEAMVDGIMEVVVGRRSLSPSASHLLHHRKERLVYRDDIPHFGFGDLSKREMECFAFMVKYRNASRCADAMHISLYTVRSHLRNIKRKLELHDTADLVAFAHTFEVID